MRVPAPPHRKGTDGATDSIRPLFSRTVPRHEFVSERYREQAYGDHPIPIAEGQTVSQPYIVALMLEVLKLEPSAKVLEVGTGSGYMTALLAELAAQVYSVERHARLARQAERGSDTIM